MFKTFDDAHSPGKNWSESRSGGLRPLDPRPNECPTGMLAAAHPAGASISDTLGSIAPNEIGWTQRKRISNRIVGGWMRSDAIDSLTGAKRRFNTALKMEDCSKHLIYKHEIKTGERTLFKAFHCRHRLCPCCAPIRARTSSTAIRETIASEMNEDRKLLFMTLTVKNVDFSWDLVKQADDLMSAYSAFTKTATYKKLLKAVGSYRSWEVTKGYDGKGHGHIHALVIAEKGGFLNTMPRQLRAYLHRQLSEGWGIGNPQTGIAIPLARGAFTSEGYKPYSQVKRRRWERYFAAKGYRVEWYDITKTWAGAFRKTMQLDYYPSMSVRKAGEVGKASAELSKYVAGGMYKKDDETGITPDELAYVEEAIFRRRIIEGYGVCRRQPEDEEFEQKEEFEASEEEGGEGEESTLKVEYEVFRFDRGRNDYYRIKIIKASTEDDLREQCGEEIWPRSDAEIYGNRSDETGDERPPSRKTSGPGWNEIPW